MDGLWIRTDIGIKKSSEVLVRCKGAMDSTKDHNNHYIYLLTEKELVEEGMFNITEGRNKEKKNILYAKGCQDNSE